MTMKEKLKRELPTIILVVTLIAIMAVLCIATDVSTAKTESLFNNGFCLQCGKRFRYLQAIGHRDTTWYLYVCDQCGNVVEYTRYVTMKSGDEE